MTYTLFRRRTLDLLGSIGIRCHAEAGKTTLKNREYEDKREPPKEIK